MSDFTAASAAIAEILVLRLLRVAPILPVMSRTNAKSNGALQPLGSSAISMNGAKVENSGIVPCKLAGGVSPQL